jgi:hypothetical protein
MNMARSLTVTFRQNSAWAGVVGNRGIEHAAGVMKEPHQEDIAEGHFHFPSHEQSHFRWLAVLRRNGNPLQGKY